MSAKDSTPAVPEYVSQADIDALLQGAGAAPTADAAPAEPQLTTAEGEADEVVISQADIDALLQGVGTAEAPGAASVEPQLPAAAGDADEVTISQADFDALITPASAGGSQEIGLARPGLSADQDAQAPAAAEVPLAASQKQPSGDRQKAETLLPSPPDRDRAASQKVILAASDGEQTPPAEARENKLPTGGRWFFSKTLWTVAAVLLILMSTVTSFYLYKRQAPSRGAAGPQAFPISQTSATARGLDPSGAARVALKGFVVPAAPDKKEVAGLIVDVELALFDLAGAAEIKKNEPYFRSLVFDLLFDALADLQHPEIDELALMARIKTSLNRALPQENIRRVALENLRLL